MNLKALLSAGVHRIFNSFGYDLQVNLTRRSRSLPEQSQWSAFPLPSLQRALERLRAHAIQFNSLIDVGASDGRWSKAFAQQFPGKQHLLLDANRIHLPELQTVCGQESGWKYKLCAVGQEKGTLYFDDSNPLGGHLSEWKLNEHYKPCPVDTIDDLVSEFSVPGPYFLKLDTHGIEIPILEGAKKTLDNTSVLVIEAYNLTFGKPAVPFWELCNYMGQIGYRPLDAFDLLYRELDDVFWQFDLLFARATLPQFQDPRYRKDPSS